MTNEQLTDKVGSPCPEFWDWLPRAYRDGDVGTEPRFTKYNMEVAYLAGRQALLQNLVKIPTLSHGVLVKLSDVEAIIKGVG